MTETFEIPTCDKCGVEITTGMMVCVCPNREQCDFWDPDWSDDIKDAIRRSWETGSVLEALL